MTDEPTTSNNPSSRTMTGNPFITKLRNQVSRRIKSNNECAHEIRVNADKQLTELDAENTELYNILLDI